MGSTRSGRVGIDGACAERLGFFATGLAGVREAGSVKQWARLLQRVGRVVDVHGDLLHFNRVDDVLDSGTWLDLVNADDLVDVIVPPGVSTVVLSPFFSPIRE